jgi:hypothetical protein
MLSVLLVLRLRMSLDVREQEAPGEYFTTRQILGNDFGGWE